MVLPYPVSAPQTAAKSPVDQTLMDDIRLDLNYLDGAAGAGGGVFDFKVNGNLEALAGRLPFLRIDGAFVCQGRTLSASALILEIPGDSGTLQCDIRKYRPVSIPIMGIDFQYQQNINSITLAGATGSTQSITAATPQVNTQSISLWKPSINIASIIYLGDSIWRYNLSSGMDADYKVGDTIRFGGCTSGSNNGDFKIIRINDDGLNNIIAYNPSGVAQIGAAGTAALLAWQYILINPATPVFVVGEKALFAGHTTAANNGSFFIYATNVGADNIIVKNPAGVAQAGVAGTVDSYRWLYTLGASISTDIVVGETANFYSHTTPGNNGHLPVRTIVGSTITVYNLAGALQGGVAGSVDSDRWIFALPTDPSTAFVIGQKVVMAACTALGNDGLFVVKQINRLATNNLVIYNPAGVTQGGAVGNATHSFRVIKFSSDQSAIFSTASRAAMRGCPDADYTAFEFKVQQVNRGGGSNYNIVIDQYLGASQADPAGRVDIESRSVFSTMPSISYFDRMATASNGVFDPVEQIVAAGRILAMDVISIPTGSPQNLTMHVG